MKTRTQAFSLSFAQSEATEASLACRVRRVGRRRSPYVGSLPLAHRILYAALLLGLIVAARAPGDAAAWFQRADTNADGEINITDAVFTLDFLFLGGPHPACQDAADANDDGEVSISDPVFTLIFLFLGGPEPPAPWPECGPDPTSDETPCATFRQCVTPTSPASVVINEFMADNETTLADGNGEFSDWIEFLNVGTTEVDLEGYFVTDDSSLRSLWAIHSGADVTLAPGEFLVVFASAPGVDDFVDADGFLHANLALDAAGEYLALVAPDGETVLSSYDPYPGQTDDVSYGLIPDTLFPRVLASRGDPARVHVPTGPTDGWTAPEFDDGDWTPGEIGVGYDVGADALYSGQFRTDVGPLMRGRNASVYLRVPFVIENPAAVRSLTFWMAHDDGYVAFLNGVEFARDNAPGDLQWNSTAVEDRLDAQAVGEPVAIDVSDRADLLVAGTNVLAIHALNDDASSDRFLVIPTLEAELEGLSEQYFATPTPGAPNVPGAVGKVEDTKFSVDRGYYERPFQVVIWSDTPGAVIRYTTDGSWPSQTRGTLYAAPIVVDRTTTLRAQAFRPGFDPTNTDTQTYIFLSGPNGVLGQPARPPGVPTTWAGVPADYEMDPEVVNHPLYRDTIADDIRSLPAVSIVMDRSHLFGGSGLYNNPQSTGISWERPASMELFSADGTEEFQVNCGIRIHGGASRSPNFPKHSLRVFFRRTYGPGKLRYDIFRDQPHGRSAADSFDKLLLRTSFNNSWTHWYDEQANQAQYLRDQWARDLQLEMGHLSTHGRYVHLYLNGLYWGIYNLGERPDGDFGASYFGGGEDDFDVLNSRQPNTGDAVAWNRLIGIVNGDVSTPEAYARALELIDAENLIDYMLFNFYFGNSDWDGHNWMAIRKREPAGPFHMLAWDTEFAISLGPNQGGDQQAILTRDRTSIDNNNNPSRVFQGLRGNEEFRVLLGDRIHRHFTHGGLLTPERVTEVWMRRFAQIDRAVVAESARWGDYRRDVYANRDPPSSFALFTRDEHYLEQQRFILEEYFPGRSETVLRQFRSRGWYAPAVEPPQLNRYGGEVDPGFELTLSSREGTVYYTLNGPDPRLPGGAVAPEALRGPSTSLEPLLASRAPARALVPTNGDLGLSWIEVGFDDDAWKQGTTAVGFEENSGYEALIGLDVFEEMSDRNPSVYVRVPFVLDDPGEVDNLTLRMKYDDGFIAYLNGEPVASRNAPEAPEWNSTSTASHPDASALVFDDTEISGHAGRLLAGPNVLAIHGLNRTAGSSDMLILPELARAVTTGGGVILSESTRVRARTLLRGEWSPLAEAVFYVDAGLRISEIMFNPADPTADERDAGFDDKDDFEFLEVQNTGFAPIQLGSYQLGGGIHFTFGDALLAPGQAVVVVGNREAFEARYEEGIPVAGEYDGKLANNGDEVELTATPGVVVLSFTYSDAWQPTADGGGHSLVIVDPLAARDTWGNPESWRASATFHGSPGVPEN